MKLDNKTYGWIAGSVIYGIVHIAVLSVYGIPDEFFDPAVIASIVSIISVPFIIAVILAEDKNFPYLVPKGWGAMAGITGGCSQGLSHIASFIMGSAHKTHPLYILMYTQSSIQALIIVGGLSVLIVKELKCKKRSVTPAVEGEGVAATGEVEGQTERQIEGSVASSTVV